MGKGKSVAQREYRKYTHSKVWRKVRAPILVRANGHCERCSTATETLQVHHLTYERVGGDELPEDLQAICGRCHLVEHGIIKEKRRRKEKVRMGPHPPKGFRKRQKAKARKAARSKRWSPEKADRVFAAWSRPKPQPETQPERWKRLRAEARAAKAASG